MLLEEKIYATFTGTANYIPTDRLYSKDFERFWDTTEDWIVSRSGIESRPMARTEDTTLNVLSTLAQNILRDANLIDQNNNRTSVAPPPDQPLVDRVLIVTNQAISPDGQRLYKWPTMGHAMQPHLEKLLPNLTRTYDEVGSGCAKGVQTMGYAKALIESGEARSVMMLGIERLSDVANWTDRTTSFLFGTTGAGGLLEASYDPGIIAHISTSEGEGRLTSDEEEPVLQLTKFDLLKYVKGETYVTDIDNVPECIKNTQSYKHIKTAINAFYTLKESLNSDENVENTGRIFSDEEIVAMIDVPWVLDMNGNAVFRWAIPAMDRDLTKLFEMHEQLKEKYAQTANHYRHVAESLSDNALRQHYEAVAQSYVIAAESCFDINGMDKYEPHTMNIRITRALLKRIHLPEEQVYVNMDYANPGALSQFHSYHDTKKMGIIRDGARIVHQQPGAGLQIDTLSHIHRDAPRLVYRDFKPAE